MSSGIDMNEYLDLFLQEADEQLTILESQIGQLESDPSEERIDSIFRAAHTIKGSSRAMGFGNMADLTHEFENILYKVRDRSLKITPDISRSLVEAVDALIGGKEHMSASSEDMPHKPELVATLQQHLKTASTASAVSPSRSEQAIGNPEWDIETQSVLLELPNLDTVYNVKVTLEQDCSMKWVRLFMVMNAMNPFGELLASNPPQEKLEAEEFDDSVWFLVSISDGTVGLESAVLAIGEVAGVSIVPYGKATDPIHGPSAELEHLSTGVESLVQTPTVVTDSAKSNHAPVSQTIRVNVSLLDTLMNLVGELVIDRTRLSQIGANIAAKSDQPEQIEALAEATGHIARITSELQEQIMRARMLPIDTVFQRFPRTVREMSKKLGKQIEVVIEGGETEVDRSVIEGISDPLIHMIRNSVDHGLESAEERIAAGKSASGTVTLSAMHKDNAICVTISDDGKGIDPARLRAKAVEKGIMSTEAANRMTDRDAQMLIFHSGFSTAKEVSDLSGRGVGMDIVRSNIQALGGTIELESEVGVGSKFILKLPLTVAIMNGLMAQVAGVDYVIPISSVHETHSMDSISVSKVGKTDMTILRGETIPVVRIRDRFKTTYRSEAEIADNFLVVIGSADQKVGIVVDRLHGEQEVVIKSISSYCGVIQGISGATILGNGRVALIVDTGSFVEGSRG